MTYITYFSPQPTESELPEFFQSPFSSQPELLSRRASLQLQERLNVSSEWIHDFQAEDGGKMFGVLVVRDCQGDIGFISAFSGMLAGRWFVPGFVPPVFDQGAREGFLPEGEAQLAAMGEQISDLQYGDERTSLFEKIHALASQRDCELQELESLHLKRKQNRDDQRNSVSFSGNQELLTELALESQRDKTQRRKFLAHWEKRLSELQQPLADIERRIEELKNKRASLSRKLHDKVFSSYELLNQLGEKRPITEFFEKGMPPGGAGDCAAPKLLQYAHLNHLFPLALAEFWWGASPPNGVRHQGHFYPACRGKCHPILPFMLKGLSVSDRLRPGDGFLDERAPQVVYEDAYLLVVNKPHGLLSVPGKEVSDSVLTRMQARYPEATGPLLLHRLDLATSGLLLVAKDSAVHKSLQRQFLDRTIEKQYVAIVSKRLEQDVGTIELPLRVDLYDRPRQVVCAIHGKAAVTHWEVIERNDNYSRVNFYPITGRTHQLRVHSAHKDGLDAPIVGDRLYGTQAERMFLHAQRLCFTHPATGKRMEVEAPPPF